jgi:carbamoyl-phosphate synthase large subunit
VNPRASRTVPFVGKATGWPIARLAALVQAGKTLAELGFVNTPAIDGFFVKEAVLPWDRLPGVDPLLGPEMRSTGEVMGHAARFGHAFAKAQMAAGAPLPTSGAALITVNDYDKAAAIHIGRELGRLGFRLLATEGTAAALARAGLPVTVANKVSQGGRHIAALVAAGEIDLIINTPLGGQAYDDSQSMRAAAIRHRVPLLTTLSAAQAAVSGIRALQQRELRVRSLQTHHGGMTR